MFRIAKHTLIALTFLLSAFVAFAAPSAPAPSVRGSHSFDYAFWGYHGHERVTIDAQIVNGVPVGNVNIRGWTRPEGGRYRYPYEYNFAVTTLEIVGNEAWIFAPSNDGYRADFVAHIVDNGPHGDLVDGYEFDGNYRIRE